MQEVPCPTSLYRVSTPPCCWAIARARGKPNPRCSRWDLVVKNGSKILSLVSDSIPVPVSLTVICT